MPEPARPHLTPRQWQVLERVALGEGNAAIAAALGSKPTTVSGQLKAIYRRLALEGRGHKRAAAAAWYRAEGAAWPGPDELPPLKAVQWRVLALLAGGANNQEIAAAAGLTPTQVNNRLRALYRLLPLGAATNQRAAAAVWYLTVGRALHEQETG